MTRSLTDERIEQIFALRLEAAQAGFFTLGPDEPGYIRTARRLTFRGGLLRRLSREQAFFVYNGYGLRIIEWGVASDCPIDWSAERDRPHPPPDVWRRYALQATMREWHQFLLTRTDYGVLAEAIAIGTADFLDRTGRWNFASLPPAKIHELVLRGVAMRDALWYRGEGGPSPSHTTGR